MRWLQRLRLRARTLCRRRTADDELDEELLYHLDRLIEENLASGLSPAAARTAAMRAMGGLEQARVACRDTRGWRWLDDLTLDLRLAFRAFLRSPSFSLVAVTSIALGIGANTAVFTVVSALLLSPLPYPSPDRLVWIDEAGRANGHTIVLDTTFVSWNEHSGTLEAIAAYNTKDVALTGTGEAERLTASTIAGGFFPILGTPMLHGRSFLSTELAPGGEPVVVLSHGLWERRFASDPGVVGRSIRLDGTDHRVVGVLPAGFRFFERRDLWLPLVLSEEELRGPRRQMLAVFGRLKAGVPLQKATTELETLKDAHGTESPDWKGAVRLTPLHEHLARDTRRFTAILAAAVALVLLIACANVANLLIARVLVRQRELTIRAALGAGRSRLARQLLAESLLLAVIGGGCGLLMAWPMTRLLFSLSPPGTFGPIEDVASIGIDAPVLIFCLVASLVSGLFFGLAPALQFSRPDLASSLRKGAQGTPPRHRLREGLLVAQVALAVVLVAGAGLLTRSLVELFDVDPGFRIRNVLTFVVDLTGPRYASHTDRVQVQQQLLESIRALPEVEGAEAATSLPLRNVQHLTFSTEAWKPDRPTGPVVLNTVSPGYFRALDVRLRSGRFFEELDTRVDAPAVILSESLARLLFPEGHSLGEQLSVPFLEAPATVVGVVADVRRDGLSVDFRPEMYLPYAQRSLGGQMALAVRSAAPPDRLARTLRQRVQSVDPDLIVHDVLTLDARLAGLVAPRRFTLVLFCAFAALALGLAAVGVYGVTAYLVEQRAHEMGVRRALGALDRHVLRLLLARGLAPGLAGVALGSFAALALTGAIRSLLFGVSPTDPLTLGLVASLMVAVQLLACWLPARRAVKADPLATLRHE